MDIKGLKDRVISMISKYKYTAIILIIGIVLMLLPGGKSDTTEILPVTKPEAQVSCEEKLTAILRQISGVGEVQVLLSEESSGETEYQTDEMTTTSADGSDRKSETVIITDANRNQTALVRSADAPVYRGAVIVCQGGDQVTVRYAITQAVIKATGLSADRICVLKMK